MTTLRLLNVEAMRRVDAAAIAAGTPGLALMERAGAAVAERARALAGAGARILVLCGPGNNGGDGYVAARRLVEAGHPVDLAGLVPPAALSGDAAEAAKGWPGPVVALAAVGDLSAYGLVVDALFGAGLARPRG